MLTRQEIDSHIQFIDRAVAELAAGNADLPRAFEVDERLRALRTQYRELPESLGDHVSRLSGVSKRFNELLTGHLPGVVDRFHDITTMLDRIEREKDFWRDFLIRQADTAGREYLDGGSARVRVRSIRSRALPPSGGKERERLEDLIRASGQWDRVSQLSRSRLEHALAENLFADAPAGEIDRLCPTVVRHQVSCYTS